MTTLQDAIADVYRQVDAPDWASPNLDGLADVLRDLGWRSPGTVYVRVPSLVGSDVLRLVAVLMAAEVESAGRDRPVCVLTG